VQKHPRRAEYVPEVQDASSPLLLIDSVDRCTEFIDSLEQGGVAERHALLLWLSVATRQLATSKCGCRVVQKAFEIGGAGNLDMMLAQLKDHVVELYESPWGNHVLSRAIELMPAAKTRFIISAFLGRGVIVSKHRYGCRIVCRLIEHCQEEEIRSLLNEILEEVESLAKHSYGNFVVQSILEHSSPVHRDFVLHRILPDIGTLAMHRTGSLVVQRVLDYCDCDGQRMAIQAVAASIEPASLIDIACSHYGSYVVEQIAGVRHLEHLVHDVASRLSMYLERLQGSEHAERVVAAFNILPPEAQQCTS
jgi:pumilio RNA-binding family